MYHGDYDFSGWATVANKKCSDGRTIMPNAFAHQDGAKVPLVWAHKHDDPSAVLGQAVLEKRGNDVYTYCSFNNTENGQIAKELVQHGDVVALSIFANKLDQKNGAVYHGDIKEVSLVLAGANPSAFITNVIAHGDASSDGNEILIYDDSELELSHADEDEEDVDEDEEENDMANEETTVQDVLDTMDEDQQEVVAYLLANAMNGGEDDDEDYDDEDYDDEDYDDEDYEDYEDYEEDEDMKHNAFDDEYENEGAYLSHDDLQAILDDGKRVGSLKDSFLQHAQEYGIEDIDLLFPEPESQGNTPMFIQNANEWVNDVMGSVSHTPFSRIKSMYADITEDEARAKGYIKGKLKKEEVFSLLKRTTQPTTIYKKQKMDRDDQVDITDFDVVAWIKSEMRMMLDEEIARAILIGDGRLASDDDHINDDCIRPVLTDHDLYTIKWDVKQTSGDASASAKEFIRACVKSRKDYRGSGNPTLFCSEDLLTDMLLLEDTIGHKLYKSEAELATAMRVSHIVTMPQFDNLYNADKKKVLGLIVNLKDYKVGADKGGAIRMFDDFDIDYNQQKYLIETRCSGSLVVPFSAIALTAGTTTTALGSFAGAISSFKNAGKTTTESTENNQGEGVEQGSGS